MKEFWLLLEAYVFIWNTDKEILIYNTLSGKGHVFIYVDSLKRIINDLTDKKNLYCTTICQGDLEDEYISGFIQHIRNSFSGNLIDKSLFPQKPFVFIPEANINDDPAREKELSYNPHIFGNNILKNLTDITINLTGICDKNCHNCNKIHKQTISCQKHAGVISIDKIEYILEQVKYSSVFDINFTGGNIFNYPYWDELIALTENIHCNKNFYTNYLHLMIPAHSSRLTDLLKNKDIKMKVLVDFSELGKQFLPDNRLKVNTEYIFMVTNEKEFAESEDIIDKTDIRGIIRPIYIETNKSFFEDFIFLDKEDILDISWKKNQIFSNQHLNSNDFGRIKIDTDGNIYSNINFPSIGKWNEDIRKIVFNQLKKDSSWRRTRAGCSPCKNCIYCFICPPVSNYEYIIGQYNLCKV